ncbi:molybdate ABC transporter substrate-binding protein [Pseudoruegeria sp. HB172150]|uniref:molybdate ABC transporter substrate-binding protein n=1 Tax=Pseudoruegeria sp. HB172150 TaxID=2721164 RepID=UPI00155461EA|nr:molybdate ABC transporter substrate-binding protein [Pseudoruegeria sp. HB172150]
MLRSAILPAVVATLLLTGTARAEQVTVFAAASLRNALDEVATAFNSATGDEAVIAYAGSSALARQIEQGAPADIFISANTDWMDHLEENNLIDPATRTDLLGNALVLIAHDPDAAPVDLTPDLDLPTLLNGGRLAMALVDAVPAGIYGKQALTSLDLWDTVAPHVAQADNVRAAVAYVALGETPYGIVYATDATAEPNVTVVGTFPESSHDPITYPAAALTSAQSPATQPFLDFLHSPEARDAFTRQGFTVLD